MADANVLLTDEKEKNNTSSSSSAEVAHSTVNGPEVTVNEKRKVAGRRASYRINAKSAALLKASVEARGKKTIERIMMNMKDISSESFNAAIEKLHAEIPEDSKRLFRQFDLLEKNGNKRDRADELDEADCDGDIFLAECEAKRFKYLETAENDDKPP